MVFATGHAPYYIAFQDLTADEEKYCRYHDLSVRERRYMDAVIEQRLQGKSTVSVDEEELKQQLLERDGDGHDV